MRKPSERNEPRLEFLREQDGEAERALKAVLAVGRVHGSEAYLPSTGGVRAGRKGGSCTMLVPSTAKDATIARHVGKVFVAQFSRNAHLDVIFVDAEQETDLRRVCKPFYAMTFG